MIFFRTCSALFVFVAVFSCGLSQAQDGGLSRAQRMATGELRDAIPRNNLAEAAGSIQDGADVNFTGDYGFFLVRAVRRDKIRMVKLLLNAKADVNLGNPLKSAIENGSAKMVKLLIKFGVSLDDGQPHVFQAVAGRKTDVLDALVKAGADVSLADRFGKSPLFYAVEKGNIGIVNTLIKAGANVNPSENAEFIPLIPAASANSSEMAIVLLKAGAKVDPLDHIGMTPLCVAAAMGKAETVVALLNAGADGSKRCTPDKMTAFDFAQETGNLRGTNALKIIKAAHDK